MEHSIIMLTEDHIFIPFLHNRRIKLLSKIIYKKIWVYKIQNWGYNSSVEIKLCFRLNSNWISL